MKILIELPTWLGDCTMATPAIENIVKAYPTAKITVFGSLPATQLFVFHPNVVNLVLDSSKQAKNRAFFLYKTAKSLGEFELAISFRRTLFSRLFISLSKAKIKANYRRYQQKSRHQVLRYNDFINKTLSLNNQPNKLCVYHENPNNNNKQKPLLGINPGAAYGSAKRWYPDKFSEVAIALSKDYDIIIFGGKSEVDIANEITQSLKNNNIKNYQNIAGKTSINELIAGIKNLDLLITSDSGPMHLGAAFQVPTLAIFGPTKDDETSQWMNEKSVIVKKDFSCQPCMRRVCPLKDNSTYHQCMKAIDVDMVLSGVDGLSKL